MKKMVYSGLCKLMQKQTYDVLSHRHGTIIVIIGVFVIIVSAFQFGEVALEWSQDKYEAVFNSFSDNVAGKSFQNRLCQPVPIDIVYTWVNGTDPKMLTELRRLKMSMEMEVNQSSGKPECPFHHCIPWNYVAVEPALPAAMSMASFSILYPAFRDAQGSSLEVISEPSPTNVSIIWFDTLAQAEAAAKSEVKMRNSNVTISQGYLTSEWPLQNSILSKQFVILSGFPSEYTVEMVQQKLPDKVKAVLTKVELFTEKGLAVLQISDSDILDQMTEGKVNFTIEGKEPIVNVASLIWDLTDYRHNDIISANRFQDNEELRYSLRSVERYAPWVRHVYIVTNGQIPGWLNLDNPRLTIITHEEIFVNQSHLPSFASPAIESHLHRIPGLSDKFIYLNDDVMFGKEVWPEDFYTHSNGQKVYLTWPVPDCQEGCPASWIKDGYCDKACNNSACEWDGGDCSGGARQSNSYGGAAGGGWAASSDDLYCSSGCANNWLADRYCDTSCNVLPCGFDAGDCGTMNFHRLHRVDLNRNQTKYLLDPGVNVAYLNVTEIFGSEGTIEDGLYDEHAVIRAATVAQKFKTMSVILYTKFNETTVNMTLKGKEVNGTSFMICTIWSHITIDNTVDQENFPDVAGRFNFTLTVNPWPVKPIQKEKDKSVEVSEKIVNGTLKDSINGSKTADNKTEPAFHFEDVPVEKRGAQAAAIPVEIPDVSQMNLSLYELPEDINSKWEHALQQVKEGDLTEKGLAIQQLSLWKSFMDILTKEGRQPEKRKPKPPPEEIGIIEDKKDVLSDDLELDAEVHDEVKPKAVDKLTNVGDQGLQLIVDDTPRVQEQFAQEQNLNIQGRVVEDAVHVQEQNAQGEDANIMGHGVKEQQDQGAAADLELKQKAREALGGPAVPVKEHPAVDVGGGDDPAQKLEEGIQSVNDLEDNPQVLKDPNVVYNQSDTFKSRKLNSLQDDSPGFLPWEKQGVFADFEKAEEERMRREAFESSPRQGRQLMDTFAESLRHVNRLYNKAYGYSSRKVPAHMPHMIDKHIMAELQAKFPKEWDETSSHALRSPNTMQFSFSYMYYLMGEKQTRSTEDIFDAMDTDRSGVLSDREIRTLATRLYELPLDLQTLTSLESMMINCSNYLPPSVMWVSGQQTEVYYDKNMPQVTKELVSQCQPLSRLMKEKFPSQTKYKYEIVTDDDVAFKMIETNVSRVVGQLDDVRKHPKKFICLNDNLDHTKEHAQMVKAVLHDFYESILPIPSSFELPREYRNRFLRMDELREWRKYRDWLKTWTQIALFILIMYTIGSFFGEKLVAMQKKFLGRRAISADPGRQGSDTSDTKTGPSAVVTV